MASNAVVLPSRRPCNGSIIGTAFLTLEDGDSVCVVLLILPVRLSCPTRSERVVSAVGKLVTLVSELFDVRRSSKLYLLSNKIKVN
jgi:hypothetical protein